MVDRIPFTNAAKPPGVTSKVLFAMPLERPLAKKYLVEVVRQSETASSCQICQTLKSKAEDKIGTIHHEELKKYLNDEKVQLLSERIA